MLGANWRVQAGTVSYGESIVKQRPRWKAKAYALLDLDGTIIRPLDGRKRARRNDPDDWEWAFPTVVERIAELHRDGFGIIIVSNQKHSLDNSAWHKKANRVIAELAVPLEIYAATAEDRYRKPRTGIINLILGTDGPNFSMGLPMGSFFCGDAAGRKGDFADTDRKFALNAALPFYTPEELFLRGLGGSNDNPQGKEVEPYRLLYPDVRALIQQPSSYTHCMRMGWSQASAPTINLMVGLPGSGKSWFARYFFEPCGCKYISADELGGVPKCIRAASAIMQQAGKDSQSIVVDNTNLDAQTRMRWVKLAQRHGYRVVCYVFDTPIEVCRHNMAFRSLTGGRIVPDHVMRMMAKRYLAPKPKESFDAIIQVPFALVGMSLGDVLCYSQFLY
jgi:bifunctional polynucleotide phosphatase/kinase